MNLRPPRRNPAERPLSGWVLLVALVLVPLYVVSGVLIVRSGLLTNPVGAGINDAQFRALLTFLAAIFAATVTTVGLLLTRSHNARVHARQQLETATKGLELIVSGDSYAPKARVAGALAVLVHLNQPVIAMRSLRTAWADGAVDPETAVWLIGEVVNADDIGSQLEAARLLEERARLLTDGAGVDARFYWPPSIYENWPRFLPVEGRIAVLGALLRVLLSQPLPWWAAKRYGWAVALLDEALQSDSDEGIRNESAEILRVLLSTITGPTDRISWRAAWKSLPKIRQRVDQHRTSNVRVQKLVNLEKQLMIWSNVSAAKNAGRTIRQIILRKNPVWPR